MKISTSATDITKCPPSRCLWSLWRNQSLGDDTKWHVIVKFRGWEWRVWFMWRAVVILTLYLLCLSPNFWLFQASIQASPLRFFSTLWLPLAEAWSHCCSSQFACSPECEVLQEGLCSCLHLPGTFEAAWIVTVSHYILTEQTKPLPAKGPYIISFDLILAGSGCSNKIPHTGWFRNNRNFSPGRLRSGHHHGQVTALFWVTDFSLCPHMVDGWESSLGSLL